MAKKLLANVYKLLHEVWTPAIKRAKEEAADIAENDRTMKAEKIQSPKLGPGEFGGLLFFSGEKKKKFWR